ncbi:hypothetical protein, partial [Janthinobacterium violaceinigrum]
GGTAARIFAGVQYTVGGKTGTAQVVGIKKNEKYNAKLLAERPMAGSDAGEAKADTAIYDRESISWCCNSRGVYSGSMKNGLSDCTTKSIHEPG